MGMAVGNPPPRAPYKREDGLMYCERCPCVYSRGGWSRSINLNGRRSTLPPRYMRINDIPDDVCPGCGTKEESTTQQKDG